MLLRIKYKLHLILLLLIQSSHLIGQSSGEKTWPVIESTNLVNKTESYNDEKNYNDLISIIFKGRGPSPGYTDLGEGHNTGRQTPRHLDTLARRRHCLGRHCFGTASSLNALPPARCPSLPSTTSKHSSLPSSF